MKEKFRLLFFFAICNLVSEVMHFQNPKDSIIVAVGETYGIEIV